MAKQEDIRHPLPHAQGPVTMAGTRRFILRMAVFILLVAGLCVVLLPALRDAFWHNPALNSAILAVLAIGVLYTLRQVLLLGPEIAWLDRYQRLLAAEAQERSAFSAGGTRGAFGAGDARGAFGAGGPGLSIGRIRLLSPMVSMLGTQGGVGRRRLSLSPPAARSLLDSIAARLDETREISRYMIGLLVMLGLLGTFWGLIQTVGSVGDVVGRLTTSGDNALAAFDTLKQGLARPLAAMGTAFSSSLFGLAGSLVLGFLDIQAGQAQGRFLDGLEEWLARHTRIGASNETPIPAYIQALLEQTADSLDALQRTLAQNEEGRSTIHDGMLRLMADMEQGRSQTMSELRQEIRLLARTIAAAQPAPAAAPPSA